MAQANPITCGNCGTENSPDEAFCTNCGEPLTRSAQEGMVEQEEAQHEGGVYGVGEDDAAFENQPGLSEGTRKHRGV